MSEPLPELPPPWIALPGLTPDNPCTQGAEEAYVVLNWYPFWQTLSPPEKRAYLDRWHATPDWREAIAMRYDYDRAAMEQDAIEAAVWAAAHPLPPRRRWWQVWRR